MQEEHKTAQVLSDAQHKHDMAVAGENNAANDLSVRVPADGSRSFRADMIVTYRGLCRCGRNTSRRRTRPSRTGGRSSGRLRKRRKLAT